MPSAAPPFLTQSSGGRRRQWPPPPPPTSVAPAAPSASSATTRHRPLHRLQTPDCSHRGHNQHHTEEITSRLKKRRGNFCSKWCC
ncbi:hypothetical protein BRADI_4g39762v3 [Brachypodium distachyon]|uniref:Uncharacterized protein n=1 Tax=Brachypodium distachyon TaxID=15368 RepID=A0A2K2CTC9_BRADI|nr:hypothetical protein BRADI_4g39762v3 [Brachypodium distachyon]